MSWVLKRTVGPWSAGTRVDLVNWPGSPHAFDPPEGMVEVRVLAGDKPIIEVSEADIVERRKGVRVPSEKTSEK